MNDINLMRGKITKYALRNYDKFYHKQTNTHIFFPDQLSLLVKLN